MSLECFIMSSVFHIKKNFNKSCSRSSNIIETNGRILGNFLRGTANHVPKVRLDIHRTFASVNMSMKLNSSRLYRYFTPKQIKQKSFGALEDH